MRPDPLPAWHTRAWTALLAGATVTTVVALLWPDVAKWPTRFPQLFWIFTISASAVVIGLAGERRALRSRLASTQSELAACQDGPHVTDRDTALFQDVLQALPYVGHRAVVLPWLDTVYGGWYDSEILPLRDTSTDWLPLYFDDPIVDKEFQKLKAAHKALLDWMSQHGRRVRLEDGRDRWMAQVDVKASGVLPHESPSMTECEHDRAFVVYWDKVRAFRDARMSFERVGRQRGL